MRSIAQAFLVGNLTRDPELRGTDGGTSVASLRLAYNTPRKDSATGEWSEQANYIDVTVFGKQAEAVAEYLQKGRAVAVTGRLEWREWTGSDGVKRQAHSVVADQVMFLGAKPNGSSTSGSDSTTSSDPAASAAGGVQDDIPF